MGILHRKYSHLGKEHVLKIGILFTLTFWMRQPALVYKLYHSVVLPSVRTRITKAWRTLQNPLSQNCRFDKLLSKMDRFC